MENKTVSQATRFTIVGILNTLVDLVILNILLFLGFRYAFVFLGQQFIIANIISVIVAMANSFILNRFWAFGSVKEKTNIFYELSKFLVVTVIGMLVINQLVFSGIYYNMSWLTDFFYSIVTFVRLNAVFSLDFVKINSAKVIAIAVSLVWNFIGYKFFVFKK